MFNIEERLKHIAIAKERFKTEMSWICDTMDDDVKQAFGNAPNGEFIIDPDGKLIKKRFWSNPKTLRADLAKLVGESEKVTKVEDLETAFTPNVRKIASGVVPRIKLPKGLKPLTIEPYEDKEHPFYAKLRVEAVPNRKDGSAKVYFGVYLDPIYEVHWNNLAGKVKIEITSDEAEFAETELIAPDVKVDSDIDPRQFLVYVKEIETESTFEAKLTYTVCDDAETFCTEVVQTYKVTGKFNRGLGTRPGIFINDMFLDISKHDKNGDGNLTAEELPPGQVTLFLGHMDYDHNGIIEAKEIEDFKAMFNNGEGVKTGNDGSMSFSRPKASDKSEKSDK